MVWSGNKAPEQESDDGKALAAWVEDELERFANDQIDNMQAVDLRPTYNAPLRPREGMIVYADGSSWNPGSGAGIYWYSAAGAWVPVAKTLTVTKQIFTANGTYTPTAGMVHCILECVGGGGAGGGVVGNATYYLGGAGGGAGSYSRKYATAADIGASKAVTIGAGGTGVSGAAGNNGADTSVETLCIGKGGIGGAVTTTAVLGVGALGGPAGTGDIALRGSAGVGGFYSSTIATNTQGYTATGGNGPFGGAGPQSASAVANSGSGGGGGFRAASATNVAGGDGGSGIVIVTEFCYA